MDDVFRCGVRHQVGAWDDKHPAYCSFAPGHAEPHHSGWFVRHERVRGATEAEDRCLCGYPTLGPREPED